MIFLAYSLINSGTLVNNLGLPQYSYYFVLQKFLPALESIGQVIIVKTVEEANSLVAEFEASGKACIFLSFTPPDHAPTTVNCPTWTVFAWEFSNLPSEVWSDNPGDDWRNVFRKHAGTIPLSKHSENLVREAMGRDYPTRAIPVPVWNIYDAFRQREPLGIPEHTTSIETSGNLIDSRNYVISEHEFSLIDPSLSFNFPNWDGASLEMLFEEGRDDSGYLGGFYPAEPWGAWSRLPAPWILLPARIQGKIRLSLECAAYGHNVGRKIAIIVGNEIHHITLSGSFETYTVDFDLREPQFLLTFEGLSQTAVEGAIDPRSMGMGIKRLSITRLELAPPGELLKAVHPKKLELSGIVYTSIFNPADHRKNWEDILTAFCFAFRDTPDATLVLKFTHKSLGAFLGRFHVLLEQMQPFSCRIVGIHGYLDDAQLEALISGTTYYVNASTCEGLCLPIMEFMSCGVPALAPKNTAMEDYVGDDTNFLIKGNVAPTIWPHDPRQLIRTLHYRIEWDSIVNSYRESYCIARQEIPRYQAMSEGCIKKMRDFCSAERIINSLEDLLQTKSTQPLSKTPDSD